MRQMILTETNLHEGLHTIAETSAFLRISKTTLRRHAKEGAITSLRSGKKILFTKAAIEKFLTVDVNKPTEEKING